MTSTARSQEIFHRATTRLVGGVNSPVRAFAAVGGKPLIADRASGSRLIDADGNEYIDYIGSWGPMILGHAHPAVVAAIEEQARRGSSFGLTAECEIRLAEQISSALPSIERIRFVCAGTEAAMSVTRAARAFTRRDLIVKFEGGYHGHADSFLSQAGSGLATFGIASSAGVPESFAALTLNVPYNDAAAVERIFSARGPEIAAVIVEPVAANMGVVPPSPGFLNALRDITSRHGALLIFDEVITGFRVAWGGAQRAYDIAPDLTILGKIIGGGMPLAAYGGRADVMKLIAPEGPVYQAGTLSGNPLAVQAGLAALQQIQRPGFYEGLEVKGRRLADGLREAVSESGLAAQINSLASLLTLFFADEPVHDYSSAKRSDTARFARFFREMLNRGILLPPSQFEAWFISAAHTEADLDCTIAVARQSLAAVAQEDS
jgi:glutamate-1-semialdehyde 2,1-aminomutase